MTININIDGIDMKVTEEKCGGFVSIYIRGVLSVRGLNFCMQHCIPLGSDYIEVLLSAKKVAEALHKKEKEVEEECSNLFKRAFGG